MVRLTRQASDDTMLITHAHLQEERKTMELISSLPRQPATQMKKIYSAMVEAKQNCEAIAFRGHRLLDQVQRRGSRNVGLRCRERMSCGGIGLETGHTGQSSVIGHKMTRC